MATERKRLPPGSYEDGHRHRRWDITEKLDSPEMIAAYLDVVFEEGDPAEIRAALGHVARARGMTTTAERARISRSALYKPLGENGNPSMGTVAAIARTFGIRLAVQAEQMADA